MKPIYCRGCGAGPWNVDDSTTSLVCSECSKGPGRMLPYDQRMEILRRVCSMTSLLDAIVWEIRMIRKELEGGGE